MNILTPFTGSLYTWVAEHLIDMAIDANSSTTKVYLSEHKLGNKTIPGLYHRYDQKWYISPTYSGWVTLDTVYDYWN